MISLYFGFMNLPAVQKFQMLVKIGFIQIVFILVPKEPVFVRCVCVIVDKGAFTNIFSIISTMYLNKVILDFQIVRRP